MSEHCEMVVSAKRRQAEGGGEGGCWRGCGLHFSKGRLGRPG